MKDSQGRERVGSNISNEWRLQDAISKAIVDNPLDIGAYNDYLALVKEWEVKYNCHVKYKGNDFKDAHLANKYLREYALKALELADGDLVGKFYDLYKKALLFDAKSDFDAFLQYIEIDRPYEQKFYAPRRHYLRPMVAGYQKILDGDIRLLTISMPKRAGKSQLGILFTLLLSGREPNKSSLMEGMGTNLVESFYKGALEYLTNTVEYNFYEIFPECKLVETNSDTHTLNLNAKRRFATILCRSIDATQIGSSEATNLLYLDDCVDGDNEADNRSLLDKKWTKISGDIIGRLIEGTPIVITGTRYSLYDPIGRLQDFARESNWKAEYIEIPALDPITDESNYEYERDGKKVFTTAYFREQRSLLGGSLTNPSRQFEAEFQQKPFESKGILLPPNELNYFFELPDIEPDSIIAVCDTAESGDDYTCMPIGYIYGDNIYIADVVYDNAPSDVTKPECAKMLYNHKVQNATFESNGAGIYFARDVEELVKKLGGRTGIRTKRTVTNKKTRIEYASDNIKKYFYFKDPSKASEQYRMWYKEVTTYTRMGKVKHDDGIDALSLMENRLRDDVLQMAQILDRPW